MSDNPVEKVAELKFVELIEQNGYYALKMEIPGWRNWPDRQVLLGDGYTFFVEFKRKGETPRKGQLYRIKKLREKGYNVYVCDSYECAKKAFFQEMKWKTDRV